MSGLDGGRAAVFHEYFRDLSRNFRKKTSMFWTNLDILAIAAGKRKLFKRKPEEAKESQKEPNNYDR